MSTKIKGLLMILLGVVLMGALSLPHHTAWEYTVLPGPYATGESNTDYLNRMGAQGWEFCQYDHTNNWWFFKRPKP